MAAESASIIIGGFECSIVSAETIDAIVHDADVSDPADGATYIVEESEPPISTEWRRIGRIHKWGQGSGRSKFAPDPAPVSA